MEYHHHGIYTGNDEVANFGAADISQKFSAKLKIVSLESFTESGMRRLVRFKYPREVQLPADETVRLAKLLVQNPDLWGKYNLFTNNCEHFATRCKIGKAVSPQVLEKIHVALRIPKRAAARIKESEHVSKVSDVVDRSVTRVKHIVHSHRMKRHNKLKYIYEG